MKKVSALLLVLAVAITYYFTREEPKVMDSHDHEVEHISHTHEKKTVQKKQVTAADTKTVKAPVKPNQEKAVVPPFKPLNENEKSLSKLAVTYAEVFKEKNSSKGFREKLKGLGLNPTTSINSNPYTGSMAIVRTKNNLPGTRYVHAQYVTDSNGNEAVQHSSFEFRKGPNALQRVDTAIRGIFQIESDPTISNGEFISYKLDENYIIWIKRMSEEDLVDDPFNAYTKNDVGTIRVAIELEIHGDDHDTHVYPDGN